MSFPRYPEYKDSGVEWLGEVPGHWETVPLKYVSTHNDDVLDEKTPPDTEIAYVDISSVNGLSGIKSMETMLFSAAPSRARRRVNHGDVIVSTVRTYLKAIARIREPEENMIVSTGFAVIRPRGDLVPDFLGYLVSAGYFVEQVIARSTGVSYPAINASELVRIPVPIPDPTEQTAIAAFLDRETAKIDALVAEQRRLMELLKEKRQAVISHAVTKGLDPDAPMKDSGIEWLGEVPAHWEVKRLKHVSPQITVGIVVEPSKYYVEDGVPALRSLNVDQGSVKRENLVFISEEANEAQAKSKLREGDLVAVRTGQPGTTAVIPPDLDGCNCIDLIIIRKPANGNEWFLSWFLASDFALIQFSSGSGGAIQQHFNVGTAVDLIIPIPPRDEQNAIVDFINAETAKLDTLTAEAQRAIDLLQERRTALISAAVTGQIDVRKEVA